jgi:hypothetical protein
MLNKTIIFGSLGGALVISLTGCGNSSNYTPQPEKKVKALSITTGNEKSLMPIAKGNQWNFVAESEFRSKTNADAKSNKVSFKVTDVQKDQDSSTATIEVSIDGEVKEKQLWLINDSGIYQVSTGKSGTKFSTPKLLVPFPVKNSSTFNWNGKGPAINSTSTEIKLNGKIIGSEEVNIKDDKVAALATETTEHWGQDKDKGASVTLAWWVPNVGIARLRQVTATQNAVLSQVMRLESYTISKS